MYPPYCGILATPMLVNAFKYADLPCKIRWTFDFENVLAEYEKLKRSKGRRKYRF